jgi:hypothetical protein
VRAKPDLIVASSTPIVAALAGGLTPECRALMLHGGACDPPKS